MAGILIECYGVDSNALPESLTAYVKNRRGDDYYKHGQSDNPYLDFITPDVMESIGVLGPVGQDVVKLRQLEATSVAQCDIYLENGDEEELIANYAERIIPQLVNKH